MLNIGQIEAREKQLKAEAAALDKRLKSAETKGKSLDAVDPTFKFDFSKWEAEKDLLKTERKNAEAAAAMNKRMGGNAGNAAGYESEFENKRVGRGPSVLDIPQKEYRGLWEAVQRKLPSYRIETKAPFGESDFTSGGLPPVLMPQLTQELPYQPDDVFDHLIQTAAPAASSVEWLQHTGNTNPAAPTAELASKPDLGMVWTTHSMPFTKIAALQSFSTESLQDFSHFMQFVPAEMFRAARDARTDQVLNGDGTAPNMQGLIGTSNVLTRELGSDTPIDCLRKSFNDLRNGSAFANASLVVTHPTTWAEIQLQKSTGGLYLLNPTDPNSIGSLNDLFGVKVVTNTWCPAGTAVVLDTSKAVLAWTRQSWALEINQWGDSEFTENYVTFRVEGRYQIGVMYPTAINIVTGLPSS